MGDTADDSKSRYEKTMVETKPETFDLHLFVAGMTARSVEAVRTVRNLCEENFQGRYRLEVIDIHSEPERVRDEQIIAVPTLVRKLPLPIRRLTGGLSDKSRILRGLQR